MEHFSMFEIMDLYILSFILRSSYRDFEKIDYEYIFLIFKIAQLEKENKSSVAALG